MAVSIYNIQDFYSVINVLNNSKKCVFNDTVQIYFVDNIIQFWGLNKDMWFSHETIDINNFNMTLLPFDKSFNQLLSLIIQYDQLYRHPSIQTCRKNNALAYRFATHCALYILNKLHDDFERSEPWKQVFILLALRHNKGILMKTLALTKIKYLINSQLTTCDSIDSIYIRFLNATIMDINKYKNTKGHDEYILLDDAKYLLTQKIIQSRDCVVHKHKCMNLLYHNVLDTTSIINASSREKSHPLYSIEQITKTRSNNYIKIFNDLITQCLSNSSYSSSSEKKLVALSISGGVDSMVCSYILSQYAKQYNIEVICLHICYNNRDCVEDELRFLSSWCSILNMKLYVRKIDEIQRMRNTKFRSCYEDVTRKIRFSFYETFNCPIILGHNLDDCYENAFSNLSKKIHFDNLYGMKPITVESGITIIRPFLTIPKNDLINYANDAIIPHLYDSTPPWSRRGQTRNTLMPAIDNFDPNILKGLKSYIEHTNMLSDVWQNSFDEWIDTYKQMTNVNSDKYCCENIHINKDTFFNKNYKSLNFWVQIWFNLELPTRPSNKSIYNVINTIKTKKYISCNLNKLYNIKNTEHQIIIVKCV